MTTLKSKRYFVPIHQDQGRVSRAGALRYRMVAAFGALAYRAWQERITRQCFENFAIVSHRAALSIAAVNLSAISVMPRISSSLACSSGFTSSRTIWKSVS